MLKNYIITAINNLLKNKLYSAINIIGLAIGLAACLIITLHVQDELSFDKHWEKADLIYRVNMVSINNDSPNEIRSLISSLALPALQKYFHDDIEYGTRIYTTSDEIKIGNERYPDSIAKVDEDFQEDLEDIEGIVQWNIGNIRAYLKFEEGKYSFVMDAEAEDPDVTMILEDIDFAGRFFSGEEDGTSAYMSGDLKIEGNLQLTMTYGSLAEYLGDYLAFLRPEE